MTDDMTLYDSIFLCGDGRGRHFFKEIRTAAATRQGPPFRFMLRCKKCTAIMVQEVRYAKLADGSEIPVMTSYLMVAGHKTELPCDTYRLLNPEKIRVEGETQDGA